MKRTIILTLALAGLVGAGCTASAGGPKPMEPVNANPTPGCPAALDFKVKNIDGKDVSLCDYKGKVVLIVNVASKCGYTPQYKGLEELNKKYHDQGLRILGFPANDFGSQEPGSDSEIKTFCTTNFNVTFDMFSKITVKGAGKHPLYQYLTSGGGDAALAGEVRWNFQKYLVNKEGKLVAVFKSGDEPMGPAVTAAVEAALK
jgi:glutathione peroxidase